MPRYLNDGSADTPKLRIYLNLDNLIDLREGELFPTGLDDLARDKRLTADGSRVCSSPMTPHLAPAPSCRSVVSTASAHPPKPTPSC